MPLCNLEPIVESLSTALLPARSSTTAWLVSTALWNSELPYYRVMSVPQEPSGYFSHIWKPGM